ncbi:MAG TPA: hypothetical protein VJ943_11665 [Desulfotignum sp.]|nr:hypothetical protein [Desulfotignum sp.]
MAVIESGSGINGKSKYWITYKKRASRLSDKEQHGKQSVKICKDRLTWHSINLYSDGVFNLTGDAGGTCVDCLVESLEKWLQQKIIVTPVFTIRVARKILHQETPMPSAETQLREG